MIKKGETMRINNYISASGLCSRREADQLILDGKVQINGEVAVLGQQITEGDEVLVNGQLLTITPAFVYLALNKPRGITSTTERHIDGNIIDFINYPQRIFPIGRLDKDSEGLILLTNDGSIVNKILDNQNQHEKDYLVTVNKKLTPSFLEGMRGGVNIYNPVRNEYVVTNKSRVKQVDNKTFKITLTQGYNRQIRRMCTKLGYQVTRLKRIRIMNIELGKLPIGKWRELEKKEVTELLKLIQKEKENEWDTKNDWTTLFL